MNATSPPLVQKPMARDALDFKKVLFTFRFAGCFSHNTWSHVKKKNPPENSHIPSKGGWEDEFPFPKVRIMLVPRRVEVKHENP